MRISRKISNIHRIPSLSLVVQIDYALSSASALVGMVNEQANP